MRLSWDNPPTKWSRISSISGRIWSWSFRNGEVHGNFPVSPGPNRIPISHGATANPMTWGWGYWVDAPAPAPLECPGKCRCKQPIRCTERLVESPCKWLGISIARFILEWLLAGKSKPENPRFNGKKTASFLQAAAPPQFKVGL